LSGRGSGDIATGDADVGSCKPIYPHRAGDVLDLLVPEILETVGHAIPHLFEYRAGDDHTPGVGERL
jgi:hypothetical protein